MTKKTALVIGAHSDDQVIGAGGTIATLSKKGYEVHTTICSYGEDSHPHKRKENIQKVREEESIEAEKILGGETTTFLDLPERNFLDYKQKLRNHIKKNLEEHNPEYVFTHSKQDPHVDHQAVNKVVLDTVDEINTIDTSVYVFEIWTPWRAKERDLPKLYIDITDTFEKKIKALHKFRSQINIFTHSILNNILYFKVYTSAFVNGYKSNKVLAELFYKVR